ncbi:hypothetical protein [Ideonella sp.]|uniref:hypothetical protein n=1 Tax=Ideonella sp. TaxID=1929293 RepID=UPI003BB75A45
MSDDFGFGLPAFKPDEGLVKLQRALREAGLAARGAQFERGGLALVRADVVAGELRVGLVKRPSRSSPEWTDKVLRDGAQLRDFIALVQKNLKAWSDRDE